MPTVADPAIPFSKSNFTWSLLVMFLAYNAFGQLAYGQQQTLSGPRTLFASSKSESLTPAATLNEFCKAVRTSDWESEFLCYSETRRSRFTYFAIRGIDELDGEVDLMDKANSLRREYEIPNEAFSDFPSMRSSTVRYTATEQQIELDRRLEKWHRVIYPKVKNWPEFIRKLQPILVENYTRHSNNITHPSQSGIVSHLNFHYFERPKNLRVSESQAEATTVAIVRDPQWQPLEDTSSDSNKKSYGDQIQETLFKLVRGRNIRRAEEKIQLILEANEWRVDSVPFR